MNGNKTVSGEQSSVNSKGKGLNGLLTIHYSLFTDKGFTYMAAMMLVVVIGITLSMTSRYWSTVAKREKEEELLFRGDQIRKGIEQYYKGTGQRHGGRGMYPENLEEMLKSKYSLAPKRSLRRIYTDPMTGKADWVVLTDPASKGIVGVRSASNDEPFKVSNFPFTYRDFEGKTKYSDWIFVYKAQAPAQPKK